MLLDAEQTWLPRRIYVIGLVQVIRDLGPVAPAKTTAYRDWNQSGTFSENAKKGIGLYSAGYQYPEVSTSPSNEMTNAPTLSGSIDTQKGRMTTERIRFSQNRKSLPFWTGITIPEHGKS